MFINDDDEAGFVNDIINLSYEELSAKRSWGKHFHPAVLEFLKENPAYIHCPEECREPGRSCPDVESWLNFCQIMNVGRLWGNEHMMTITLKHCCGVVMAIMFPKFFTSEWPRRKAQADKGYVSIKNSLRPFLSPMQELDA